MTHTTPATIKQATIIRGNAVGPLEHWTPGEWLQEFAGESGELSDAYKKMNRLRVGYNDNRDLTQEDVMQKIAEEVGDCYISLQMFCTAMGIDIMAAAAMKFNITSEKMGQPHRLVEDSPVFIKPIGNHYYDELHLSPTFFGPGGVAKARGPRPAAHADAGDPAGLAAAPAAGGDAAVLEPAKALRGSKRKRVVKGARSLLRLRGRERRRALR